MRTALISAYEIFLQIKNQIIYIILFIILSSCGNYSQVESYAENEGYFSDRYDLSTDTRSISYSGDDDYRLAPSFSIEMTSTKINKFSLSFSDESYDTVEGNALVSQIVENCDENHWLIDGVRIPINTKIRTAWRIRQDSGSSISNNRFVVFVDLDNEISSRIFFANSFSYAFCSIQGTARPSELAGARQALSRAANYLARGTLLPDL